MNTLCGIFLRTGGRVGRLDAVLAALPGRDSDGSEAWVEGPAGLAWRGDAVADQDAPTDGPLVSRGGELVVSASARLDDRASLCDCLGVPGPDRPSLTDTALILRAYQRWGAECPGRLLGDYAFGVWDARRRTLFCARDHIGTRPLYYSLKADQIVFASSVSAVLAAPGVSEALDEEVIATRLTYGSRFLGARTFYRAVRRLPPGHRLVVGASAARVERWWYPENAPPAPSGDDDALAEAFLEIYEKAVADRVRGRHRVGVHLTGGLDSSSVAVLAARVLRRAGRPVASAFCWQPAPRVGTASGPVTDEYGLIEAVAREDGLPVLYCPPGVDDFVAHLRADATRDADIHANEEPLRRRAAEVGVRVILSGWGGDEGISYNGRGYFAELLLRGQLGRLWREAGECSRHPLARIVAGVVLPLAWPGAARAVDLLRRGTWRAGHRRFIRSGFARRVRPLPDPHPLRPTGTRRMRLDLLQRGHLADRIEGWAAGGARHGIEYRYPLLDRRVLEFALGLPPGQFRRGRWSRWFMRSALNRRLLPPQVCWNRAKEDPARVRAFLDAYCGALPVVRRIIEDGCAPQLRRRYLDMPRLMKSLDPDRVRAAWPAGGRIYNALRILDF